MKRNVIFPLRLKSLLAKRRIDIEYSFDTQFTALAFTVRVNLKAAENERKPIISVRPVALDRTADEMQKL